MKPAIIKSLPFAIGIFTGNMLSPLIIADRTWIGAFCISIIAATIFIVIYSICETFPKSENKDKS